jgi:hypothetical protein
MKIKHSLENISSETENFYMWINPVTNKKELWEKGFYSETDSSLCEFPHLIKIIA